MSLTFFPEKRKDHEIHDTTVTSILDHADIYGCALRTKRGPNSHCDATSTTPAERVSLGHYSDREKLSRRGLYLWRRSGSLGHALCAERSRKYQHDRECS